jgi:hypothetical protein
VTAIAVVAGGTVLVASASPATAAPTSCLRFSASIPTPTIDSSDPTHDPIGQGPADVAFDASTDVLFVGGPADVTIDKRGAVVAVDRATNATLATIPLPGRPTELAVNAATNRIYAGEPGNGTLSVIDGATYTVAAVIQLPGHGLPFGMAIDDVHDLVYVATISDETGVSVSTISLIDGTSNTIIGSWDDSLIGYREINGLAVNRQTNRLYASGNVAFGKLLVFDASSLTLIDQVNTGAQFGASSDVALDESTNRIYTLDPGNGSSISVFDGATDSKIASIGIPGSAFSDDIALDPTQHLLYFMELEISNGPPTGSQIVVIDLTTNAVLETPTAASGSAGVDVAPTTGELFVASGFRGAIDVYQERACDQADTDPPVVHINAPTDGATIPIYSRVLASWDCSDAGSGLALISDPVRGADFCFGGSDPAAGLEVANGQLVDTLTPGTKSFTVTATDNAGLTTTVTHTYTVVGDLDTTPPDVVVTSPVDGASYAAGENVLAHYSCRDSGGAELAECGASQAGASGGIVDGQPIDTRAGPDTARTLTVFGMDRAGNETDVEIHYTVIAPPPAIVVHSPIDGAEFTLGQTVSASYRCADSGSGVVTCVGTVPSGTAIDTSTPGTHVFTVNAMDSVGNTSSRSLTYTVFAGDANQTVSGGEIVTTDPGGLGPSPAIPVQTQIAVPDGVAGTITVSPQPVGTSPAGFVLFGTEVDLTGPAAPSAATPYVTTFTIDASALGTTLPADVQVFRNGVAVPDCTDASAAIPDPCVEARGSTPDASGDAFIAVRTTQFGAWSVGGRLLGLGVTGVNPSSQARGVSHQAVVVTGSGFVNGSAVAFPGGGITVNSTLFVDPSHLSADISISNTAALGARDVRVTNPGAPAPTTTCAACFTVNPRPTISSLSPNARPQGAANQNVTITGTNFEAGAAVAISGSGVVVNSVTGSGSSLNMNVSLSDTALPGARAVTVTNPDGGVVTKNNAFTVSAKPLVTSAAPSGVAQGATVAVQIFGSNFASGGTVSFGPDITMSSVTRNSATKLTAHIVVSAGASLGARDITVVNPDGGTGMCAGCLTVNPPPTITTIDPPSRPRAASHQLIAITGTGYQAGVKASIAGGGVTVNSVTRNDPTSLTLAVSISNTAAIGARDLTITNPDGGAATCTGCFTVNARPAITAVTPNSKPRGGTYTIVITGTGLQTGATVSFSGTGIQVNSVAGDATTLTVSITIASNAAKTHRDVTITNPDTGTITKTSAFTVT